MSSKATITSPASATAPEKAKTQARSARSPRSSPDSPPSSGLTARRRRRTTTTTTATATSTPPIQSPVDVDAGEVHEDQVQSYSHNHSQSRKHNQKQKQKQAQQPQMQYQNSSKRSNQNLLNLEQNSQQQQHPALSSSKPLRHVVGRSGTRNLSGKNLNNMGKFVARELGEVGGEVVPDGKQLQLQQRYHRRSASGTLMTARAAPSSSSTSPRAGGGGGGGVRRNLSTLSILKHNTSQTRLKRDPSSGQLVRAHGSARNMARMTGKDGSTGAPKRRSLSGLGKPPAQRKEEKISPSSLHAPHAVVRFDIGDDEGEENEEDVWTESSASQSPAVTRSNSRASTHRPGEGAHADASGGGNKATKDILRNRITQQPGSDNPYRLSPSGEEEDDASAKQPLRRYPADDDEQPKVSSISGTVVASGASAISHRIMAGTRASEGSTLVDHSGTDLVSRFIQGSGSAGTPQDAAYMRLAPEMRRRNRARNDDEAAGSSAGSNDDDNENSHRNEDGLANGMSIDTRQDRRNKSTSDNRRGTSSAESGSESNKSDADNASPKREKASSSQGKNSTNGTAKTSSSAAAAAATSKSKPIDPLLLTSRTQQKLWLQRASSNMEPGSVMPVTLPRSSSILIGAGAHHFVAPIAIGGVGGGGGNNARIDPRLQRQFDQTEAEYRVVRRFRSPVAEAVARLQAGKHWSFSSSSSVSSTMVGAGGDQRSEKEPLMNGHSGLAPLRSASVVGIDGRNRSSSNKDGVRFSNTSQQSQRIQQANGPGTEDGRRATAKAESIRPVGRRARVSFEIAPGSLEKDGGQAEGDKARREDEDRRSESKGYRGRTGVDSVRDGRIVHDGGKDYSNGGNDDGDYGDEKDADADADVDVDVDAHATYGREDVERDKGGSSCSNSGRFEAEEVCRRLWDSVQILGED